MLITGVELACFCGLSLASNMVFYAIGFGNAIMFLMLYQLCNTLDLIQVDLRYGILLQSLNLVVSLPWYLLVNLDKSTLRWKLLIPIAITDFAFIYVGQYVQKQLDVSNIKLVVGLAILTAALLRLYPVLRAKFASQSSERNPDTCTDFDVNSDDTITGVQVNVHLQTDISTSTGLSEKKVRTESVLLEVSPRDSRELENTITASLVQIQSPTQATKSQHVGEKRISVDSTEDYDHIVIYSLITGVLAGFLGGLVGAEGPAIILFFLMFKYDKAIVRTVGLFTAWVNIFGRVASYALTSPPEEGWPGTGHRGFGWFVYEDWPVYLGLLGTSIVGALIGTQLYKRVKQGAYDNLLTSMLVICGLAMVVEPLWHLVAS